MKTLYFHGEIYTGSFPLQEALIVEEGKFMFVGSTEEALKLINENDEQIDLNGCFVSAGFNDSHMHLLNYGQTLNIAPLHLHTHSLQSMLECLSDYIAQNPGGVRGNWILGRGWNQDYFTDVNRMPNRYDLDQVSTELPICAIRACGHALVLNSKALEMLRITKDTPQIDGGQIVMENGEPNGLFFDNAMDQVYESIPAPSKENLKEMIRLACKSLNSYGVTSCHSDDYCVFKNLPWRSVNLAFKELEANHELTVRVYEQSNFTNLVELREFIEEGNTTGIGSDWFKIGPLKMLGDGALGARTAYLSKPYADDPSSRGIAVFSREDFERMIEYAHSKNMQVAIHAIGDACLDDVINAIDKALLNYPKEDHRHGIVHCQITQKQQLEKMASMKLHIYAQSLFLDYDINIVEKRVGKKLAATSYSWKTLKDLGATVSNGTDCPVELPFALGGIQCAVTRKNLESSVGPYLPNEAFSVQEALDSYTSCGAYASFEEKIKGKIEKGLFADFVVLSQNLFKTKLEEIKNIEVLATYVNGEKVYEKETR